MSENPSPEAMILAAIQQFGPGAGVEAVQVLEKLVELKERGEKRLAFKAWSDAMAAFQRECPPIHRASTAKITSKRTGSSFTIKYAELDEIARTINPICAKLGLSYTWKAVVTTNDITVTCIVRHLAGHAEESSITLPVESEAAMSDQQKVGAALTYGRRQTVSMAFGLSTSSDTPETNEVDPTLIDDDMATEFEDLLKLSGANRTRFLEYMGVDSLSKIRLVDYQKAKSALEQAVDRHARQSAGRRS